MRNSKAARTKAATKLAQEIEEAHRRGDEQIVVVAHSHGVNVVKEATSMISSDIQIDQVVGLGGPVRGDYSMKLGRVGSYINVYSDHDAVQKKGGRDGSKIVAGLLPDSAGRIDPQATVNVNASTIINFDKMSPNPPGQRTPSGGIAQQSRVGHFMGPATIHGPDVWGQHVTPVVQGLLR